MNKMWYLLITLLALAVIVMGFLVYSKSIQLKNSKSENNLQGGISEITLPRTYSSNVTVKQVNGNSIQVDAPVFDPNQSQFVSQVKTLEVTPRTQIKFVSKTGTKTAA